MDDKLYVLIRKDLSPSQQAVQAGHAVAEHLLRGYKGSWINGTLVYLGVKNQQMLKRWKCKLEDLNLPYSVFREPDLNGEITALAAITNNCKIFKSLQINEFT